MLHPIFDVKFHRVTVIPFDISHLSHLTYEDANQISVMTHMSQLQVLSLDCNRLIEISA